MRVSSPSGCVFAAVGEPNSMRSQSPTDIFRTRPSPVPEEAPFGLSSSASAVPPAREQKQAAVSWSSHCVNGGSPCDCARDRVEEYEGYFRDGEVLPVPELVEAVEPGTLSFVVADVGTRRLAGIGREAFEDLLKAASIPGRCFCRRSFATWDVLLPSEEVAKGLAGGSIAARFFRLQPEYRGRGGVRVAVCSVSVQLSGDVLAAYLSMYGGVEQVTQVASARGAACGGCVFVMCLDGGGFNRVPHKIRYRERTMTVVVEGRKPLCWFCNNIGHFSKNCPQKPTITTTTTTTAAAAPAPVIAAVVPAEASESQQEAPKGGEEGWTQVARKRGGRGAPPKNPATADAAALLTTTARPTTTSAKQSTAKQSTKEDNQNIEPMDMSMNLKRRRNSEDSPTKEGEKKNPKKPTQTTTIPQHKGEKTTEKSPVQNKQRPAQLIPLPQKTKTTPIIPTETPLPPSLSPIKTPKMLTRSYSATRLTPSPQTPSTSAATVQKPRARSTEARRAINSFYFCEDIMDNPHIDHTLKQSLKPLRSLQKIDTKDITKPHLFKDAPKLTTFVRLAGNRTKELWNFIDEASRADVMLVDTKNPMLKKMLPFCAGRVPILVHPSFYRSLKLRYPMDVGGITRDDRVSTELGTGSLRQAVGILTPKDFRPVVDTE